MISGTVKFGEPVDLHIEGTLGDIIGEILAIVHNTSLTILAQDESCFDTFKRALLHFIQKEDFWELSKALAEKRAGSDDNVIDFVEMKRKMGLL